METVNERCADVWKISNVKCRDCDGTYRNKDRCPDYRAEEIAHRGILPGPHEFAPATPPRRGHKRERTV